MTTEAALAGLVASVAVYVGAAMADRALEIALGRRNPREWDADPLVRESREGWAAHSIRDLFRSPQWALGWLAAIGLFSLAMILLDVHWWLLAILAVVYAGRWTRAERYEARAWARRLREEHPDSVPQKRRALDWARWAARFVLWVAFIGAPAFLGAAIASLF